MLFSIFEIINFLVIFIVVGVLIYYFWRSHKEKPLEPSSWKDSVASGRITRELIREEKDCRDKIRFFNWWLQIQRIERENVIGDFAELGVYKGHSARIIHLMAPDRKFHLFDTFEGFPEADLRTESCKAATYTPQHFGDTSMAKAKINIGGNENIIFHPGYFPDTAKHHRATNFAFVNMDADLYKPTRAGLEFFYPRLSPGGVIIIHDYNPLWPGIEKAVDEFVKGIPESPVLVPDLEGTILIIRNSF